MPVYSYTAFDVTDCETTGTLIADTPLEGRAHLRERGLRIESFGPARLAGSRWRFSIGSRIRRQEQVAEVSRYLSLLMRAGVPLAQSLEVLTRKRSGKIVAVLKDLKERVTGGQTLGDALAEHGDWFDPLFVSAVRVGELSGDLDEALCDLAEHLQNRQRMQGRLTAALTYPLILVCVGLAVVIFLMSYVVPQMVTVLAASGRPLPASTALLKGFSDALVHHGLLVVIAAALVIAAGALFYRSHAGRRAVHRGVLRLPILGPLMQKSTVAQFAQQMALLLKTGVPFVAAARHVADLSRNPVLTDELRVMAGAIEAGSDIAPTMVESEIFPPVVTHLVAVGQSSGALIEMFTELAARFETEVRLATAKFTAALEPLLIVVLAAMVGFVVFACLMPMLEATKAIA